MQYTLYPQKVAKLVNDIISFFQLNKYNLLVPSDIFRVLEFIQPINFNLKPIKK